MLPCWFVGFDIESGVIVFLGWLIVYLKNGHCMNYERSGGRLDDPTLLRQRGDRQFHVAETRPRKKQAVRTAWPDQSEIIYEMKTEIRMSPKFKKMYVYGDAS
jgi:hypothetical protein